MCRNKVVLVVGEPRIFVEPRVGVLDHRIAIEGLEYCVVLVAGTSNTNGGSVRIGKREFFIDERRSHDVAPSSRSLTSQIFTQILPSILGTDCDKPHTCMRLCL